MSEITFQATITVDCDHDVVPECLADMKCESQTALLAQFLMLWYSRTGLPLSGAECHVSVTEVL